MHIRLYALKDKAHCVDIFKSNCPEYLDPREFAQFESFLDSDVLENYFVIEDHGEIVGCGGFDIYQKKNEGRLTWGLVHKNYHKKGYGKALFEFRFREIRKALQKKKNIHISLETSQKTYRFFEKLGFKVIDIAKDFYGKELDKYTMELKK